MISMLLGRSTSLENPRHPLERLLDEVDGGEATDSGIRVNRRRIMGHPAIWGAIQKGSRSIARIPCTVYARAADGEGKEVASQHPAYRLLRYKADPEITAFKFFQTLIAHAMLGDAFAYIYRRAGRPVSLLPLDPDLTHVVRDGNELGYLTQIPRGENDYEPRRLDRADVIHLKGLSFDGREGYQLVQMLKQAFALALAQRKYRSKFFANYARPSVALMAPKKLDQPVRDNLINSYRKAAAGLDNAHRAILLEEDIKIETFSNSLRDSQAMEAEEHELVQIANIFGMAPHKVGAKSNVSYKSLEQENQAHLDDFVDPWMVDIEQELMDKLLTTKEKESDSHIIEFNRRAIVRADMAARFAAYNLGIMGGWINRDEARAAENMNPIPDGKGKEFLVPLNMGPAGEQTDDADPDDEDDDEEKPKKKEEEEDDKSRAVLLTIFKRDFQRMVERVRHQAVRAAKSPQTFGTWLDRLDADHARTVAEALTPTAEILFPGVDIVGRFMRTAHEELLDLSGKATAANLPAKIETWNLRFVEDQS